MEVAIAGAGIGGLTAAALLARHGHDVVLVEQAARFGEVGAGLQLSPNAARVLHDLGLGPALDVVTTRPTRAVMRRWDDDRELLVTPLGPAAVARWGFPYANVHRADLVEVLAGALDGVTVRFGATVVDARTTGSRAALTLADGSTVTADVVVGADGIHSAVRRAVLGPQPARFSGSVAYRALVPGHRVGHLPVEVTNRVGPDRHLVSYFVGRDQRFHNLVCVVPEPSWEVESWTEPGSPDDLRAQFRGWSPAVQELLGHITGPVFRWALHDRPPLPRWSVGRVTLLGDACHPMLPFLAQGACQAIEDAAVLTRCLDEAGAEVPAALERYEALRRPRTTRIQQRSWANATTYHLPDGPEQEARDALLAAVSGSDEALGALDWLYGFVP